ncbi:MAG: VOC family protein [Candidatus Omnitrophica bacterium]|nr:VOC family protein [Candidatus Omnitrophota bacterium]
MQIQPYLFFEGRCQEALDFYQKTLGAEVVFNMTFGQSPDPTMCAPGMEDKVMHAEFKVDATTIMASDGRCQAPAKFQGFSLSISVPNSDKAEELFDALGEGGEVQMPLMETFYSPKFGMVADKFGVSWMVIVPGEKPEA